MSGGIKVDTAAFIRSVEAEMKRIRADAIDTVKKGAIEVTNEAEQRTPVRTGALRSAWKWRETENTATRFVVTVSNDTPYFKDIEYGTKQHTITATNAKVLTDGKGNFFGKTVEHPGTKPRPMLAPAVASVLPRLEAALRRIIK
jgi:hypothetical protein